MPIWDDIITFILQCNPLFCDIANSDTEIDYEHEFSTPIVDEQETVGPDFHIIDSYSPII